MDQVFGIVKGGIFGLANTITDNSGKLTDQTRRKFGVKENQECFHHYNCAYKKSILLQGKLYVFCDRICFFSVFNNQNLVGQEKTYIVLLFNDIQSVKKKKVLGLKNTIEVRMKDRSIFIFTSFLQGVKAYESINKYRQIQMDETNQEELWLEEQLQRIALLESIEREQQNVQQNSELSQIRQEIQENQRNIERQLQNSVIRDNNNNNNMNQIENSGDLAGIYNSNLGNSVIRENDKVSNYLKQVEQQNNGQQIQQQQQQQQKPNQTPEQQRTQILKERQQQIEQIQILQNQKQQEQEEEKQQQVIPSPLELQKQAQKQWEQYQKELKEIFKEREIQGQKVLDKYKNTKIKWESTILTDMSVREVYLLFFSNQMFEYKIKELKQYKNFMEFYMIEYNDEYDIEITEIIPQPPEFYESVYSDNALQLKDFPLNSARNFSFTHPLEPSILLPEKIYGKVKENLYWISDKHFIQERFLNFQGISMADCFEPRVVYDLVQQGNDVEMRIGFYIHFKKNSFFKKKIEQGAKKENEKAQKELQNLFYNISEEHKKKREANKVVLEEKLQNSFVAPVEQLLKQSQIYNNPENDFEIIEEEEKKLQVQEQQEQSLYYSGIKQDEINKQNESVKKQEEQLKKQEQLSQEQVKMLEDNEQQIENINQAMKASNTACTIF